MNFFIALSFIHNQRGEGGTVGEAKSVFGVTVTAVCTENSDSCVLVVQSADERMRHDAPDRLNGTRDRRILV